MKLNDIFTALQETSWAHVILEGSYWFPSIETIHVLAVTVFVGTIWIVDLRLLGVAAHTRNVRSLMDQLLPVTWGAFVIAFMSGFLLFSSQALDYAHNWPFRIKMILLVAAGLNMWIFHFITHRKVTDWDSGHLPPGARLAGGLSLSLWVIVICLGRWIGFTIPGSLLRWW